LLNVVMTRLIGVQREQIAAIKAFGYTNLQVGWHYVKLVLLISLVGAVLGIAIGGFLGRGLTVVYTTFYRFPVFGFRWDPAVIVFGLGDQQPCGRGRHLGVGAAGGPLPPAEAMRPETPAVYRPTILDRSGLGNLLPQATRMIFREIERRPIKAVCRSSGSRWPSPC
jgi:putative ABC transport system permease protein